MVRVVEVLIDLLGFAPIAVRVGLHLVVESRGQAILKISLCFLVESVTWRRLLVFGEVKAAFGLMLSSNY